MGDWIDEEAARRRQGVTRPLYDTDDSLRSAPPAQRMQRVIERLEGYVAARAMVDSSVQHAPRAREGESDGTA